MDELKSRREAIHQQKVEAIADELCASIPEWLVRQMNRNMQDAVFHLAVKEATERISR